MAVDNYSTITQPPLGIAYLAAYARRLGHSVHVVDAVGEAVDRITSWPRRERRLIQGLSFPEIARRIPRTTELIGISCMFTHAWPMVRELIRFLAEAHPQARMIAGGEHMTSCTRPWSGRRGWTLACSGRASTRSVSCWPRSRTRGRTRPGSPASPIAMRAGPS